MRYLSFLAVLAVACLAASVPAFSQTVAATPSTTIDLSGILQSLSSIAFTGLALVGAWLAGVLVKKLGLDAQSAAAGMIDTVLENAVHFGVTRASALITSGQFSHVDVHNQIAAHAVSYAQSFAPVLLKSFGLSTADVEHLAIARIGKLYPDIALPANAAFLAAAAPDPVPATPPPALGAELAPQPAA